jgi:hypothetical protein
MVKISLLDTLNDPFELMPYLRYDLKERRRIKRARQSFSKRYGLLCLSGNWSEPLLWGHYAEKHKGIALGFEVVRDEVIKVKYSESPIREQVNVAASSSDNDKQFSQIAQHKYGGWRYEDEYRVLVILSDCMRIDGHRFLRFDGRLKVREIVLGCHHDKNNWEYLLRLARRYRAKVIPTRMEWQGYRIVKCGASDDRLKKKAASLGFVMSA